MGSKFLEFIESKYVEVAEKKRRHIFELMKDFVNRQAIRPNENAIEFANRTHRIKEYIDLETKYNNYETISSGRSRLQYNFPYPKRYIGNINETNLLRLKILLNDFINTKKDIFLVGEKMAGKTYLTFKLIHSLYILGYIGTYYYYRMSDLLVSYDEQKKIINDIRNIGRKDLIFIDDIMFKYRIERYAQMNPILFSLLESNAFIIFTTNNTFEQLSKVYDTRIIPRIQERFNKYKFVGNTMEAI